MTAKIDMLFKTPYEKHERHYISSGNPIIEEYEHKKNKYGQKTLEKTGEKNLYQMIQEAYEDTKIENVLARVTAGDTSMLKPDGIYGDMSIMPRNMVEAQQIMQDLQNTWNKLPLDVRASYNHDVGQFVADSGSEKWEMAMGLRQPEAPKAAQPETPKAEGKGEAEA